MSTPSSPSESHSKKSKLQIQHQQTLISSYIKDGYSQIHQSLPNAPLESTDVSEPQTQDDSDDAMDAEAPLYDVDLLPPQEVRDHVSGIPDSITATGHLQDKMRTFQNVWKGGRQWLQYDNASHVCWCEPCAWALAMNRFPKFIRIEDVRRSTFAAGGFIRWFKGKELDGNS